MNKEEILQSFKKYWDDELKKNPSKPIVIIKTKYYSIWKYLVEIPTIKSYKLDKRLTIMYNQYMKMQKLINKYQNKNDEEGFKEEMKAMDFSHLSMLMVDFESKKDKLVSFDATFKDVLGQMHTIKFVNVCFFKKPIQILRKLCKKYIGVACQDIIIDNNSIIGDKGEFIQPLYMSRQKSFIKEIGLTGASLFSKSGMGL